MFNVQRLLRRGAASGGRAREVESDFGPTHGDKGGLEQEYRDLIAAQLHRCGIADAAVQVEVRQFGQAPNGLDVFVGMLHLTQWERDSGLRVLLGLPLLETRVRTSISTTWLADVSHFGGLWLHASEQIYDSAKQELRHIILQHAPPPPSPNGDACLPSCFMVSSLQNLTSVPEGATGEP
jgi:hypothetical protein